MVKQEHYVPKFYLRKFSDKDKISVYDIKNDRIFSTNINKIACNNYFYDLDSNELKETLKMQKEICNIPDDVFEQECNDVQFVEKALSRLEDKFSSLLLEFEKDYSLINNEEFLRTMFLFAYTLSIRTIGFRNGLESIARQTKEWLEKINIKNVDYPIDKEPEDIAKINQINELLSLSSVYKKALSFFDKYDIFVGINNSNDDFIISDNPLNYFFLGFNDVCFPVNRKLSIIMQVKDADSEHKLCNIKPDNNKIINLTTVEINKYNNLQVCSNGRYLFGSKETLKKYSHHIKKLNSILGQ